MTSLYLHYWKLFLAKTLINLKTSINPSTSCPNCGCTKVESYCPDCGQTSRLDYSFKSIISDIGEVIWGSDSRLFRTLKDYLNAGVYLKNWLDGKQARYITPVKMFLLINLFYFILISFTELKTLVTPLQSQLNNQIYSEFLQTVALDFSLGAGLSIKDFAELYDSRVFTISNSMIIFMAPIFACFFLLLNFRNSRLFYHHLVTGFYYSGIILLTMAFINILFMVVYWFLPDLTLKDGITSAILIFILFIFTSQMQKRMYNESNWMSYLKGFLVSVPITITTVFFYRFLLFWITSIWVLISS